MRNAAVRAFAVMVLAGGLLGCGPTGRNTTMVVSVWSDLAAPTEIDNATVVIAAGKLRYPFSLGAGAGRRTFPLRVAIVPGSSTDDPFDVEASGTLGGQLVVSQAATVSFVPNTAQEIALFLGRGCVRHDACTSGSTCQYGMCVPMGEAGVRRVFDPSHANQPPDSSPDAAADSRMDGAVDAGRPDQGEPRDTAAADANADASVPPPQDARDGAVSCGLTMCGADCADLMSSEVHCGACGYACLHGRECIQGRCTPAWVSVTQTGAPSPRFRHGASLINGQVLLSGGANTNNTGAMSDAYFYDPKTDRWSPAPSLRQARCAHTSVSNGNSVYVFGGLAECANGGSTGPGLEVFDVGTNTWKAMNAPNAPDPRYNAVSTWIPSQGLFVYGGAGGFPGSGAILDPTRSAWRDATCTLPGCAAPGVLLSLDNNTIVQWGTNGTLTACKFDLTQGAWSTWIAPTGTPPIPGLHADDGRRWYVLEKEPGSDCPTTATIKIYDKARGTWTVDAPAAPKGLTLAESSSNHAVWTGTELFTWSAHCDARGVGALYQPAAP